MKGLSGLLKNEFIKIKKQKSLVIAMCIIFSLCAVVPLVTLIAQTDSNRMYVHNLERERENILSNIEYLNENNDKYDEYLPYELASLNSQLRKLDLFIDNGVAEKNDWRWKYSSERVDELCRSEAVLTLYLENYRSKEFLQNNFHDVYWNYIGAVGWESIDGEPAEFDFDVEAELASVKAQIDECGRVIKENNTYEYHRSVYEGILEQTESLKSFETEYSVKQAESLEKMLPFYKIMMERNVDITRYSWEQKTAELASQVLEQKSQVALMPPENFDDDNGIYFQSERFTEYEEYVKAHEYYISECDDAYDILLYSMENRIPTEQAEESSARSNVELQLNIFIQFIAVFAFVLFGSVVANEFTNGTVRLLLIRPRKRYKILTSKLLASTACVSGLAVATLLVSVCVNAIAYGNAFTPYLYAIGDSVIAVPSLVVFAGRLMLCLVPLFALCTFGVLISILTKRSILAVALPLMVYISSPVLNLITTLVLNVRSAFRFSITSYLNLAPYFDTAVDHILMDDMSVVLGYIFGNYSAGVIPTPFLLCVAVVMVYFAIGTVISYVVFNRTEIKG